MDAKACRKLMCAVEVRVTVIIVIITTTCIA